MKNIQLETKKQSQLKHLVVLLARILAIILIVLAFSKPYIPSDNSKKIQNENAHDGSNERIRLADKIMNLSISSDDIKDTIINDEKPYRVEHSAVYGRFVDH